MKKQVYIDPKNIMQIEDIGRNAAYRKIKLIQDTLDKLPHQRITVEEYAKYEGVSYETIGIEPKYITAK